MLLVIDITILRLSPFPGCILLLGARGGRRRNLGSGTRVLAVPRVLVLHLSDLPRGSVPKQGRSLSSPSAMLRLERSIHRRDLSSQHSSRRGSTRLSLAPGLSLVSATWTGLGSGEEMGGTGEGHKPLVLLALGGPAWGRACPLLPTSLTEKLSHRWGNGFISPMG